MKLLKYSLFVLAPLGQLSAAVHTFDGLTPESALTTAETGWSLSETNTANAPLAYVGLVGGNTAGGLGGEYADPAPASTSVKLTMTSSLTSYAATIGFDVLIKDSTNEVPARDVFGFSVAAGSGASVVQLKFLPVAQSFNPEGGEAAQWRVAYTISGGNVTITDIVLTEQAKYFINLTFIGSDMTLTVGNTVGSSSYNATVANFSGDEEGFGNLAFDWSKSPENTVFGDNSILFDNISVAAIPEPSALLMSGVASLVLLGRRRRN